MQLHLQTFSDLQNLNEAEIHGFYGGKAWGLYFADQLGISVPQTWLIGTQWYQQFFQENPDFKQENFLSLASSFIQKYFISELSQLPDITFAVRSSSQFEDTQHQSFAGIFKSELHVTKAQLVAAIAAVWASCLSDRVAAYFDDPAELKMAVVIQPMLNAKYAGICFSQHPAPPSVLDKHHILIEMAAAEGEKIVQGEITPLRFSGNAVELANTIDEAWCKDLLEALTQLRTHLNYEIDMEFVVDQHTTFYLVQQRPISTHLHSKQLDLLGYFRAYKRTLYALDIEMLITGCSDYLANYLQLPFRLDRWMVMTSSSHAQELWLDKIINQSVINKIVDHSMVDNNYLSTIHQLYLRQHQGILNYHYGTFFNKNIALFDRFQSWLDFITPLNAHYYLPMFMIDALSQILTIHMRKIDKKNAEADLLKIGTASVRTLGDFLREELTSIKREDDLEKSSWQDLPPNLKQRFQNLAQQYGFLKCHQPYEAGYTGEDLFNLIKQLEEKTNLPDLSSTLHHKYITNYQMTYLFEQFQIWMNIRNQEMEYLLYAILKSRPLFEEIAAKFSVTVKDLWHLPSSVILDALRLENHELLKNNKSQNLTIYRENGKTQVSDELKIIYPSQITNLKNIQGKTVYGEGKLRATVKLIFHPQDLQNFKPEKTMVLVTGMTTPDYIPLMKNFAGLITDEGGILCHAAILARELEIPTIVGTGTATEILTDGMVIEIDFDRGIVQF